MENRAASFLNELSALMDKHNVSIEIFSHDEGVDHMGLMFKFITEIDGSGNIKPSEEVEFNSTIIDAQDVSFYASRINDESSCG